jgi:hypothetical protein
MRTWTAVVVGVLLGMAQAGAPRALIDTVAQSIGAYQQLRSPYCDQAGQLMSQGTYPGNSRARIKYISTTTLIAEKEPGKVRASFADIVAKYSSFRSLGPWYRSGEWWLNRYVADATPGYFYAVSLTEELNEGIFVPTTHVCVSILAYR